MLGFGKVYQEEKIVRWHRCQIKFIGENSYNSLIVGANPALTTKSKRYSESLIQDLNNGLGIGLDIL